MYDDFEKKNCNKCCSNAEKKEMKRISSMSFTNFMNTENEQNTKTHTQTHERANFYLIFDIK